jgi:hypothetical protein
LGKIFIPLLIFGNGMENLQDLAENPFRNIWVERKWKNQNE